MSTIIGKFILKRMTCLCGVSHVFPRGGDTTSTEDPGRRWSLAEVFKEEGQEVEGSLNNLDPWCKVLLPHCLCLSLQTSPQPVVLFSYTPLLLLPPFPRSPPCAGFYLLNILPSGSLLRRKMGLLWMKDFSFQTHPLHLLGVPFPPPYTHIHPATSG